MVELMVQQVGNIVDTGNWDNPQRGRIYSTDGISPALNTVGGGGLEPKVMIKRNKTYNPQKQADFCIGGLQEHQTPRTDGIAPSLTAAMGMGGGQTPIINEYDYRIRKLTPKECWRLMGFSDGDFEKAEQVNSNSQLYKQAGNSIVVDVLYYIFVELYKAMPYLFDDLRLSSFFSGIGAFECALDRLYDGINERNFINP